MPFRKFSRLIIAGHDHNQQIPEAQLAVYRKIFEASASVMLIIDPVDGGIIDANPAACRFYQYDTDHITDMTILQINTMAPEEIMAEMENARAERRGYFNFRHRLANGEIREVEAYSSPIFLGERQVLFSIIHDISARKKIEREKEELIVRLEKALEEVKVLSGLLPICASCKNIRDDQGYWQQIEAYLGEHAEVEFTHGICPDCIRKLYPELANEIIEQPRNKKIQAKSPDKNF
ncbi:MAG: PAS domain S-box protein [Deltaproteobacteria bacterium]|nr:PAS domain S-box protein [Deltaproteobacteria bacterium]